MSQFFTGVSSGNLPPEIPLNFLTEFAEDGTPNGISQASSNDLYVTGSQGIITQTESTGATDDTILIHYTAGEGTTAGATTADCLTLTTSSNSAFTASVYVVGYETSGLVFGGQMIIVAKNLAGTASIVSELSKIKGGDAALTTADITAVASGSNVIIRTTGVATYNINWYVMMPNIVSGN